MKSGCKFIVVADITEYVAHEQKPEKESGTHLRKQNAGKELANANVLRDDCTEWVQERIKVSVAGE